MGSATETITIFKQCQKFPPGNLGYSFQICTYDLRRRKSHFKLMKQERSSHTGNISTTRERAGSNTGSHRMPWHVCSPAAGSLPDAAYGQSILSCVHGATLSPCTHGSKYLGQRWPQSLSLSNALEHQALHACTYAYVQTTPMLGQREIETGSGTCVTHGLDKSWGTFWK